MFIDLNISDASVVLEDLFLLLLVGVVGFGVVGSLEGIVGIFCYVVGFRT
jgi:hypothetical protein